MKKLIFLTILECTAVGAMADDFFVCGRVKSALNKVDLPQAYLLFDDADGNVRDSFRLSLLRNADIPTAVYNLTVADIRPIIDKKNVQGFRILHVLVSDARSLPCYVVMSDYWTRLT